MIQNVLLLLIIFVIGEFIFNLTVFQYIKNYFAKNEVKNTENDNENTRPFLFLNISVFKGMLERLVLFVALILNFSQVLILFGTLKIGSRFDKNVKVMNDYFIVGNFSSILISIFYWYCYLNLKIKINT